MKFTTVTERPTEGQYIEVWEYNGLIWSSTCRNIGNGLVEEYDPETGEFFEYPYELSENLNMVYLILDPAAK